MDGMNALSRATSTVLQQGFESLEDADNVELLARGAAADIWRVSPPVYPSVRVYKALRVAPRCFDTGSGDILSEESYRPSWQTFVEGYLAKVSKWASLDHPNLLRVFGIGNGLNLQVEFCENGCVRDYLKTPTRNISKEKIISDVLAGMTYLHGQDPPLIHGNLNAGKIFIHKDGTTKIGEFGLAALCHPFAALVPSISFTGLSRWLSPELLDTDEDDEVTPTTASDVWALGCTMLEILTEDLPYAKYKHDIKVQRQVLAGHPPGNCDDHLDSPLIVLLWPMVQTCWEFLAPDRPAASELAEVVGRNLDSGARYGRLNTAEQAPLFGQLVPKHPGITYSIVDRVTQGLSASTSSALVTGVAASHSHHSDLDVLKHSKAAHLGFKRGLATLKHALRKSFAPTGRDSQPPSSSKLTEELLPRRSPTFTTAPGLALGLPISSLMSMTEVITRLGDHGCKNITSHLDLSSCGNLPANVGGFGCIYRGKLLDGSQVTIKTVRRLLDVDRAPKQFKDVARELNTWSKCQHPNVVPLLGLVDFRGQIGMVSIWMKNGYLPSYLQQHPDVDRCQISAEICNGLSYLHTTNIVHGDVRGSNVLISDEMRPMLTGFGDTIFQESIPQFTPSTYTPVISIRWAAPELMERGMPSFAADVYALGMTILETITGKAPYADKIDMSVMVAVLEKEFPPRPEGSIPSDSIDGEKLWSLLTSCWAFEPERRPSVDYVRDIMKTITPKGLTIAQDK